MKIQTMPITILFVLITDLNAAIAACESRKPWGPKTSAVAVAPRALVIEEGEVAK